MGDYDLTSCPTKLRILQSFTGLDCSNISNSAELIDWSVPHQNGLFEQGKAAFLSGKDLSERDKHERRFENEGLLVHREGNNIFKGKRFNPLKWKNNKLDSLLYENYDTNETIANNLFCNYFSNENEKTRRIIRRKIHESYQNNSYKLRRRAMRMDQRLLEGVQHPENDLDSNGSRDGTENSWCECDHIHGMMYPV